MYLVLNYSICGRRGGLMVSVLYYGSKGGVGALAGLLHCVLGQHTLLSLCLFLPRSINVYWSANCQGNLTKCWGEGGTCDGLLSHLGVAILLVTSCYGNRDKLWWCGPLGSCARLFFFFTLYFCPLPCSTLRHYTDNQKVY